MIIHFKCDECGQYYRCNIDETHNYTTDTRWYNQGSKQIIPLDISEYDKQFNKQFNKQNFINTCPDGCWRILDCGHVIRIKSKLYNYDTIQCNICKMFSTVYYTWCGIISQEEYDKMFNTNSSSSSPNSSSSPTLSSSPQFTTPNSSSPSPLSSPSLLSSSPLSS